MGNTHTHRGGRRSGGRHSRDTQAGARGPGAGAAPAGRGPQAAWPRPANDPAAGPATTLGPRTPFADGAQAVPPAPSAVNPASNGRGKPAPDPLRNGNGAGRPADRRRNRRDPFASPPPGSAVLPTWSENGEHHGGVPPTPPAPLVHLHGANGHLALVPPPADADADATPTAAPEVESWTPRSERSSRAARAEREHEPLRPGVRGEVGPLIEALHDLFEHDRAIASLGTSTRCGICYLHYARTDLVYREAEGFYACPGCAKSLGAAPLNMVRRQQK